MNLSHWQALIRFNTIFYNLVVAYFLGHPCIFLSFSRLVSCKWNREAPSYHKFQQFINWLQKIATWNGNLQREVESNEYSSIKFFYSSTRGSPNCNIVHQVRQIFFRINLVRSIAMEERSTYIMPLYIRWCRNSRGCNKLFQVLSQFANPKPLIYAT